MERQELFQLVTQKRSENREAVVAGNEAQAGSFVPLGEDRAVVVHEVDRAFGTGPEIGVGIVGVDQANALADVGVVLSAVWFHAIENRATQHKNQRGRQKFSKVLDSAAERVDRLAGGRLGWRPGQGSCSAGGRRSPVTKSPARGYLGS
jgi:hypothetical protein